MQKILIANRGEIACRIMRTCARLGIESLAIYSAADRQAQHVQQADRAIPLSVKDNVQAYLSIDEIISIAKQEAVDGIHPGYGFLAENAEFARACTAAGIPFIGPSADAMQLLGDKNSARSRAISKKVPIAAGSQLPTDTRMALQIASDFVAKHGFPALIKAAAGGGGKGMRLLTDTSDIEDSITRATREAQKLFGNGTLFIEQYVSPARHVEIQFIADSSGAVGILFDRDCSLQRNNQKIVEEAPAPDLSPAIRSALYTHTRMLVENTGYVGVGTAEFLVNDSEELFFLEVNTRLQVEHPVTERITGLDLVELQIAAASGAAVVSGLPEAPLPDVHAIELRICAESSDGQFLPSSGLIAEATFPESEHSRIDTGYVQGDYFPPFFDSLLAKIIVHASNRTAALEKATEALRCTRLFGVENNCTFLHALLTDKESIAAPRTASVGLLRDRYNYGALAEAAAARLLLFETLSRNPEHILWRSLHTDKVTRTYGIGDQILTCSIAFDDERTISIECGSCVLLVTDYNFEAGSQTAHCVIGGKVEHLYGLKQCSRYWLTCPQGTFCFETSLNSGTGSDIRAFSPRVEAELPGQVLGVHVKTGDLVTAGTALITLESMKMEHEIIVPTDAKIETIHVVEGQQVSIGEVLLELVEWDTEDEK